jgi:hypothetical protein
MRSGTVLRRNFFLIFPALLLIGLSALPAAEFWESKTYYEWTNKECAKLLTDSPWAWELKIVRETSLGSSDSSQGQQFVSYIVQFQSALPVRQAMVRQAQIANKYDSLSKEQKQAFDKSSEAFLNTDYSDKVVVNVAYSTNIQKLMATDGKEVQNLDMELARMWQSKVLGVLSNSVYLYAGKGEKARLLDFKVGQGAQRSFQFIFPRQAGGKPLLSDQDKSLTLEFAYPTSDTWKLGDGRAYAEFKVKKMILNGTVQY